MTLEDLQRTLALEKIDALLVTHNNLFLGQDILPQENIIMELTNFSGSAGTLLISPAHAWLIVDGRYTLQARNQVNNDKIKIVESQNILLEVKQILQTNNLSQLAFNPWCLSVKDVALFKNILDGIEFIEYDKPFEHCLSDQPVNVFEQKLIYAGVSAIEKSHEIGNKIPLGYDAILLTAADQVSWLTNLRSDALPDTPILRAYALLERNGKTTIFADNCLYPGIYPFHSLPSFFNRFKGKKILIDKTYTPQKILSLVPEDVCVDSDGLNPLTDVKLTKNAVELNGFQNAHIRDGVAMVKFLHWLEKNWSGKNEWDIVLKLYEFRKQQPLFYSNSFPTIAAAGANAAIVHYQPSADRHSPLLKDSVLLIDSGAQYFDGTTDVTRTLALGSPPPEIKNNFTYVLKAHIRLANAHFPEKTKGCMLDALCREPLWKQGKDYKHGTGHSVGHFSNVHESPFGISPRNDYPLGENFVTSIEPGYYQENSHGIRIENMVYTIKSEAEGFLKFADLTLIPIDKTLINKYLLDKGEQAWLDSYHQKVLGCLAPYLDTEEKNWLKEACSPI